VVGRERELVVAEVFLDAVGEHRAALVIEGEAGIGKTTIWEEVAARACERGYRVLSSRPVEAEAKLSYAALADLLSELAEGVFVALPDPQRRALDAALLRADPVGSTIDQRAVSAALLATFRAMAETRPLLVAIDDVQWLDSPSMRALEFVVRRLGSSPVSFLVSVRREGRTFVPLGISRAFVDDRLERLSLEPLSLGGVRQLLATRLGWVSSRPLLLRVARTSGGNPFFALEIARALANADALAPGEALPLPDHLAGLVALRIERLPSRTRQALLVASALARPTLALLEQAGQRAGVVEKAVDAGLIEVKDGVVRFAHPLLGSAVYMSVAPQRRRALHRQLAAVVTASEERARHLALGANGPSTRVAAVLDKAAVKARARGAPDTAADLLEQSLALTPPAQVATRRRRTLAAAEDYFYAGDRGRARALLTGLLGERAAGALRADALRLLAELRYYDDSWPAAAPLLVEALAIGDLNPGRRARIELDLAYALFNIGNAPAAGPLAESALEHARLEGELGLLAQALAVHVAMGLSLGRGVDQDALERALKLEDYEARTVVALAPTFLAGQVAVVVGDVGRAHSLFASLRDRLITRGRESDLPATAALTVWAECLRGDLASAKRFADEAVSASLELESQTTRALALSSRAIAHAYRGEIDAGRRDGEEALALFEAIGWTFGAAFPTWTLGFLALSVGEMARAHSLLQPLAEFVETVGLGEPMLMAPFLPDEIEVLIALGQLERAERLLDQLEQRGRELDRAWALATGARCRGLLFAARGELDAAVAALEQALVEHQRLEMPFELGRTLLVLGQTQRRLRQKRLAKESLERAKETFGRLDTPLWSGKVDAELARLGIRRAASELTETERRVAELAAGGLTNREIAANLFVSSKTVEVNLTRIYRKLGVHSRAALVTRLAAHANEERAASLLQT
jgi:DNA-binding CsgD family transcriptional regulator/KaiC/GvpD/RAD55 family RecA-like ATPase